MIPLEWRDADVLHLAPIADEIELDLLGEMRAESLFMTPQGWLRRWEEDRIVRYKPWQEIREALASARAVVTSLEDLGNDPERAAALARVVNLLVVTCGEDGAWLYDSGKRTVIPGEQVQEVDPTGSGDIFAAVFFTEIAAGVGPLEAARRANFLAGQSVSRSGLESIPTQTEIEKARGGYSA
jgi:sugar/nucleoside kinase (ribokinase family)